MLSSQALVHSQITLTPLAVLLSVCNIPKAHFSQGGSL